LSDHGGQMQPDPKYLASVQVRGHYLLVEAHLSRYWSMLFSMRVEESNELHEELCHQEFDFISPLQDHNKPVLGLVVRSNGGVAKSVNAFMGSKLYIFYIYYN